MEQADQGTEKKGCRKLKHEARQERQGIVRPNGGDPDAHRDEHED